MFDNLIRAAYLTALYYDYCDFTQEDIHEQAFLLDVLKLDCTVEGANAAIDADIAAYLAGPEARENYMVNA